MVKSYTRGKIILMLFAVSCCLAFVFKAQAGDEILHVTGTTIGQRHHDTPDTIVATQTTSYVQTTSDESVSTVLDKQLPNDEPEESNPIVSLESVPLPPLGPMVKVEGRKLMVDFDRDGIYEPYFIRGVGYNPYPVGTFPSEWGTCEATPQDTIDCDVTDVYDRPELMNRDFPLLVDMHANTIRTWSQVTETLLNKAYDPDNGIDIKVIAGFWVETGGANPPAFVDPSNPEYESSRQTLIGEFQAYVNTFKDHPAILFWAIGNENNYQISQEYIANWYSLVNLMAEAAHAEEGFNYHPVAVVNGDIDYIGEASAGASDELMPYLDIWGANVYRGSSFEDLFNEFASKSSKPLWIAEYGIDAWHTMDVENPEIGYENQQSQAQWDGMLWDEIVLNNSIAIGATVMKYLDSWWPPMGWAGTIPETIVEITTHDYEGIGPSPEWTPPSQDNYFNEEWWGIVKFDEVVDINNVVTRKAYNYLKARFQCDDDAEVYYAGPYNGKSCDRTNACCSKAHMKSKEGQCVPVCKTSPTKLKFKKAF